MFPVSLSILASFMSAVTILGTATEMYRFGTQYMVIMLSYFIVIPSAAYLYMPVFYRLEVTSAYEVRCQSRPHEFFLINAFFSL